MTSVALIRNVNQGQRGHPATADLLQAFADAGAIDAVPFQSNGTIVFESAHPDDVVQAAMESLAERSGMNRDGFVIPLALLSDIVDAHALAPDASRHELTLHSAGVIAGDDPSAVREAAKRRCRIVATGGGWAVLVNERDHESNANPTVERITGAPASSRGFPTLVRLLDRFAPH